MKKIILSLLLCLFMSLCFAQNDNVLTEDLQEILNQKNNDLIDINILLKSQMPTEHLTHLNIKSDSKEVRREIVINELKKFSQQQQESVMSVINAETRSNNITDVTSHWIVNSINCKASRDVIYTLASHPDIKYIDYNKEEMMFQGEDQEFVGQDVRGSVSSMSDNITHVQADKVWDLGYTGKGVIVAVIDSGINTEHVDLKDHLWYDEGAQYPGYNFVFPGQNPTDDNGHGTHCSGTVCGDGTSGLTTGMAPDATLMPLKITNRSTGIGAGMDRVIDAIEYAADNGADIISISIGWWATSAANRQTFRQAFENTLQAGIVVAAAAGNNRESLATYPAPNNINSPADCPPPYLHSDQTIHGGLTSVISVGAVDENNVIAGISSQGPVTWANTTYGDYPYNPGMGLIRPDIVAPGASVKSLAYDSNTGYAIKGGTSMAAPCVAGVMALMLEKNPELTPADLCRIIETTATKLTQTKSNDYGSGCINALAAVQAVNFDVTGSYLKQYSFTKNFVALTSNANQNLELTLINNGTQAATGTTNVTLTSNDAYVTVVNGNASINNSIAVGGTATCNFTIKINTLSPDNHIAELTVNAGTSIFNIEINISNEFVAPSNFTTEVQNLRNVYLSWNATNNATGYKIYRDGAYVGETSTTSYTDENLDYGTLYTYTITSKRGELETEHSREIRVQTADNPEAPSPTNIVATDNNSSVAISWNNSTGSKGSNIYRKDNITGTETQIASNVSGNSYTDNISLQEGIYQYGVTNLHSEKETIYEEGFENNGTSLPEGWNVYRVGASQRNWSVQESETQNSTTFTPYMGQYAAFSFYGANNYTIKYYLVTSSFDLSEYQGSDVTLSFYYITPAWGTDVNNLNVRIGSSSTGPWDDAIWTSDKTDVTEWTKAEVDLTSYIGSTFYITFENEIGYGLCSAVDDVSIAVDGSKESRIEWSDNIYKNVNVINKDGDWNNTDNWATNQLPTENDNHITIDANVVIKDEVTVNSLTINEGKSLTLNRGAKLIVKNEFNNNDPTALIINDGAQVVHNSENLPATFNMNIVNPNEWSSNNKTGWQFIASPVKDAKINDFIPQSSDYDLYRYDGTKNLEWINHKDENDYGDDDEPETPVTPTVPEAPVVTAEALSASSLLFSWDAVDGATSYNVYSAGNLIAEEITVTSYTANYLYYPNTEYCFSFSAVNEAGESAKTEACATTLNAKPITPYEFTATATGESTIELSWSLANRATNYNVYQGNEKIATVTETTYTVEELESGTEYCFTVTAQNEMGESDKTAEECATTEESIPAAPVVTAEALSSSSILLSWEAVKGATKYNIYSAGFHIAETTETTYTVTPVAANTETCIVVRAANGKGESGDAEVCATSKPSAPTNLMATAKGTSSIKLSWADSNNGVTYNIYQGSSLIVENITDRSFTVEGLEKSTEYCFTVKAVNEVSGESSASNEACATTKEQDDEPGTIQESVTVGNGGNETTVLPFTTSYAYSISQQIYTFEDVEQTGNITGVAFQYKSGASGTRSIDVYMKHSYKETFASNTSWESMTAEYKVYSGDIVISGTADEWVGVTFDTPFAYTGGNFVLCVYDHTNSTLSGTTFHADQDQLDENKSLYYYPLFSATPLDPSSMSGKGYATKSRNNIKLSFAEGGQDPVTPTVPAAPVVTAEAAGTSSITLTWNTVAGATSYKVYSAGTEIAEVLTISHTVGYLQAGTNYCFSVSAVNAVGESEKSEACATTKMPAPAAPEVTATPISSSQIQLSWEAVAGATSYKVYSVGNELTETTGTNYTVSYLQSNTLYCFSVSAINENGESALTEACAMTLKAKPIAPELTATATGETTIELSWNAVDGATSYNVYQDGSPIASDLTGTSYTVGNLEAGTKYCFTVTAVNTAGESDESEGACAITDINTLTVDIDEIDGNVASSESNFYFPVYDYSSYALSQQIYTAEEIGFDEGTIYSVSFRVSTNGGVATRQYEVYMKNIDEDVFTLNKYLDLSSADKVFDGNVQLVAANQWYTVKFTTPFNYTGGNVLLCVYDKSGTGSRPYHTFYRITANNRSLYSHGDSAYDPTNLTTGSSQSYVSQVRFEMTGAFTKVPNAPELTATANSSSSISLTWDAVSKATSYNVYQSSTQIASNITEKSYTVEGLEAGEEYCFTVTAVNEIGESEHSEEACATPEEPAATCNVVFTLNDDQYKNGWFSGYNYLNITYNETTIMIKPDASSYEQVLQIPTGTEVSVELHVGFNYYISKASFDIKYEDGDAIYSAAAGSLPSQTTTMCEFTVDCTPAPEPTVLFFYDFEDITLEDHFTLIDKDVETSNYSNHTDNWAIENNNGVDGSRCLASYSYKSSPQINNANNYIVTKNKYSLTENSKLTFDCRNSSSNDPDYFYVEVSTDGENFTPLGDKVTPGFAAYQSVEFDLGARLAAAGLAYGEYHIALHHNEHYHMFIRIDNFKLTDNSANSRSATREVSSVSPSRGVFGSAFQQGVGYLASYENENTAVFQGNLNHEKSYVFPVSYNSEKDLANFHLLGNPFSFNMKWSNVTATNLASGYAVVNETGGYTYRGAADDEIAVGDGFFVKATGENPSISYSEGRTLRNEKSQSIDVVITGNAGSDNVVVNLGKADEEGFPKLKNFNEEITTIFVYNNDKSYGIYNCEEEVEEVPIYLNNTNGMGKYTISIDAKGDFENITLVDLVSGDETNMLVHDYNFTASQQENTKRFILKFVEKQQTTDNSNFVYQSGEELIVNTQGTVQIIDVVGRVVYNNVVLNESERINISGFTTGTYIVRVISDKDVMTQKVVVY